MNLINAVIGVLLLAILIIIGYKVGQMVIELQIPGTQQINETKFVLPVEPVTNLTLRWTYFPLTVFIDNSFIKQKSEYVDNFRQALEIWESSTNNLITFFVTTSPDANIMIEWVPSLKEKATDTLGNTDLKFINISEFGLIKNAKIELLTKSDSRQLSETDMINLALHEIGHALGLSHSNDENDIMYPVLIVPSKEIKKISISEIQKLQEIYSIQAQPDLRITEINVSKATVKRFTTTFYLVNISLIIENVGLIDAVSPALQINTENEKVKQETLPDLPVGNKLSIILGNVRVDNDFSIIEVIVDPDNLIKELNEENNFAKLSLG